MYDSEQRVLEKCYCELEKRIHEHDRAEQTGFEKTEITLGVSASKINWLFLYVTVYNGKLLGVSCEGVPEAVHHQGF